MSRPNRRLLLDTVSIGRYASESTVIDNYSVAIGRKAGQYNMGDYAIAIGEHAGESNQGIGAIAIGRKAGQTSQFARSIVLSTSDIEIKANHQGLYIDPIRKFNNNQTSNILCYEHDTKEVLLGFPKLPVYASDDEVILAFTTAGKSLSDNDTGTLYLNSTVKKVKVWIGNEFTELATLATVATQLKETTNDIEMQTGRLIKSQP
jgi:hypothetical protein